MSREPDPAPGRAPAALDPRVGQVVAGRYRLTGKIGRGGMGAVYEALHATTGKRFAVKMLLPGLGKIAEIARRFEREAHAASLLAHPNIVNVVDFGALDDGALFLVMELVSGRSLTEVARARLHPTRALAILRQVLEALAHAHAEGVVHRDLKPDNIMLVDAGASAEERDIVKLLDFGIAKLVGDAEAGGGDTLTQAGVAFGTPDYMAPEQALGEEVDARADLYAAGVIAYELLVGERPFVSDDKVAVLRMHVALAAPPADGAGLAPEVAAFLARALEKRRADRYQTAAEMIAALDAAAAAQEAFAGTAPGPEAPEWTPTAGRGPVTQPLELPLAAVQASPSPPPPDRRGRRRRVLGAALIAAAAVAAAGLGLGFGLGRGGGGGRRPALLGPAPALPLVGPARQLLEAGNPAGAAALLEPAVQGPLARDQDAWLALGAARDKLGKDEAALAAYTRATELGSTTDPGLRAFVDDLVRNRPRLVPAALDLLPRMGPAGAQLLAEQASRGKTGAVRARARDVASRFGVAAVDLLGSYTLDLERGASCRERREAVAHMRALRDKRAIPALRKARGRRGGFLGLEDMNGCLDRDASEAIDFLAALP